MKDCHLLLHADDEVGQWVASRVPNGFDWVDGTGTAIGFTYEDRIIAGVVYFRYNGASIEVGFASENPRWMSKANLWRMFHYPFEYLNLRRLTAIVDETNLASRKLIEALGFQFEATLKDAAKDGNQLVFRMLKEDCKWLH